MFTKDKIIEAINNEKIITRQNPVEIIGQRYKSAVLGKEYPVTDEGFTQMQADEAAYWEAQKNQ